MAQTQPTGVGASGKRKPGEMPQDVWVDSMLIDPSELISIRTIRYTYRVARTETRGSAKRKECRSVESRTVTGEIEVDPRRLRIDPPLI